MRLTGDPEGDRAALQRVLDGSPGGTLTLPPGRHRLSRGLVVPAGWTLCGGPPGSTLAHAGSDDDPLVHVLGSDVVVRDLVLEPAPADPGRHGGDRGTGITVGRYLYDRPPEWISRVEVHRVRVHRPGNRAANGIALMGAVREVTVQDVTVVGAATGLAVHWGAVGTDVATLTGPSYHPHRLTASDVRVRDAFEGFYLSSVHDVTVAGACLDDVEIGFRLLPGDNTGRYAGPAAADVGRRIEVRDVCVRWTGDAYAVRVAGWGRSEVDGAVTVLRYADTTVRDCVLRRARGAAGTFAPLVVERADGVDLGGIRVDAPAEGPCCRVYRSA